ncbi:hypothetical protein AVEN_253016-1 [Araneus ventricosus]|uniref:Uncharacterized protein n=1 Tax=Araneus ventricosus TaxID=182803 RepID=A0A4Y2F0K4_ARAVE|nr:hypothetical protein AVEN_253016-1 [Araneus ventricosus]
MIAPEEETNDISSESDEREFRGEKLRKVFPTVLQFCEKNAQYSAPEVMELHLVKERFMNKKNFFSSKQTLEMFFVECVRLLQKCNQKRNRIIPRNHYL